MARIKFLPQSLDFVSQKLKLVLRKYKTKPWKYKLVLQKYKAKPWKYKLVLRKYKAEPWKYKLVLRKYKAEPPKHKPDTKRAAPDAQHIGNGSLNIKRRDLRFAFRAGAVLVTGEALFSDLRSMNMLYGGMSISGMGKTT